MSRVFKQNNYRKFTSHIIKLWCDSDDPKRNRMNENKKNSKPYSYANLYAESSYRMGLHDGAV